MNLNWRASLIIGAKRLAVHNADIRFPYEIFKLPELIAAASLVKRSLNIVSDL